MSNLELLAGSSGTYGLTGGTLSSVACEIVGNGGNGIFNQSGGLNFIAPGSLWVGNGAGGIGVYNLNGGTLTAGSEFLGYNGTATFTQTAGVNTITGSNGLWFYLGYSSSSSAAYNLGGGTLTSPNEFVGYATSGTMTQTGGVNSLAGTGVLTLAYSTGSSGVYNLNGGSLSTYSLTVANSGSGTFNQTGGVNTLAVSGALYVGNSAHGSGGQAPTTPSGSAAKPRHPTSPTSISAAAASAASPRAAARTPLTARFGSLYIGNSARRGTYTAYRQTRTNGKLAANEYVGKAGSGNFVQSGGANSISSTGNLYLGYNTGVTGSYSLSSGSLPAYNEMKSDGSGIRRRFAQSGGTTLNTEFSSGISSAS